MKKYTLKKYKYLSLKKRKIKRESSSAKALLNKLNQLAQDKQLYKNHLEKHETLNINGMRELITEHENLNKVPDEELVDYKLLQKIDRGLIVEEKEKCLYGLIIETATTIMQSDHVSFHIYIPEKRCLKLSDYRGLNDKFAKFWQCVYELDESTYAHVMTEKKQIFVLDIEDCDFLQDTEALNAFRLLGIRSVLSSPLFSKSGEFFGVLSTHWNKMHQPLDRDFSLLDVIIRQSADLMEQVYERSALQENKMWITGLKEAFHAAMSRKPLAVSLRSLIDTVILQTKGSAKAAFYLIPSESDNLQHSIALSNEYAEVLKIFPEEPHFIDWSLVMNKEEPIITPDVELDPAWEGLRPLARKHNCRACWFFPIATPEGRIFGTLAIYYTEPREPTSRELEMASVLTHATAIIISLEQELVARMQTESVMRTSEQKLIEQVRLRDEFIANAGHELNSPLTCMMLYTNIIEQSFQENNTPFQFEILNKLKKTTSAIAGAHSRYARYYMFGRRKITVKNSNF
ncbi:Signal transduction protein containing GAF and PtsI domains [Legionella sainthelensi]|uniref:sensor histidine kinase n=1 Tax=Legionella sainthelensi TaxID=28087 RepID=UPI000F6CE3A6|nr:GAF domain-containing protein [Legionella sainthelensi]VEB36708.1 Signal transduction protein containing GAF and PtsI domains [Legionella sainthelensi]